MQPTPRHSLSPARLLACCALALVLAACSSAVPTAAPVPTVEGYPGPGTAFPTAPPPPAAYPALGEEQTGGTQDALVAQAVADLALRAGVDASAVQVVEVTAQSWPDASLGCPLEGQLYAQVVTAGYRIVLEAGGTRYAYHTDQVTATYCEQDTP